MTIFAELKFGDAHAFRWNAQHDKRREMRLPGRSRVMTIKEGRTGKNCGRALLTEFISFSAVFLRR